MKWIGAALSVLLVVGFLGLSGFLTGPMKSPELESKGLSARLVPAQEKEETDTHGRQLLKRVQEVLDGWLKSLNEKIENEDVTRLEVRFYEMLRSIVEWAKEKVDARLESDEKGQDRKQKGLFRDTRLQAPKFTART